MTTNAATDMPSTMAMSRRSRLGPFVTQQPLGHVALPEAGSLFLDRVEPAPDPATRHRMVFRAIGASRRVRLHTEPEVGRPRVTDRPAAGHGR
jgi:hypothetical protein